VGLLTAVVAQALLVARVVNFAENLPFILAAFTLIGVWMVLANNHLGRGAGALPPRLAWLGEATGAAFALLGGLTLVAVLVAASNPVVAASNVGVTLKQHPVFIGILIVVGIPVLLAYFFGSLIWLIGVGHRLLAMAVVAQETVQPAAEVAHPAGEHVR
jgi:hypothetical protein